MSDERIRPVSGEIIVRDTDGTKAARAAAAADVVDAEFETLRPDPADRLVSGSASSVIGTTAAPLQGFDTLRKGDAAAAHVRTRGGPLFWTVGLGLAAGAFWVSGGHALVRHSPLMPAASQAQPANPLRISGVTSKIEEHGERQILFVDGKAINEGNEEQALPPIEISVIAKNDHVMRYKLGTSADPLAAGAEFSFSSRFEAPKEGVKSVSVAFRE